MRYFQKMDIKDIVILSALLFFIIKYIYTGTSHSVYRGGSANLLTNPVEYYIYLIIKVAMFIGYVTYVIVREEKK